MNQFAVPASGPTHRLKPGLHTFALLMAIGLCVCACHSTFGADPEPQNDGRVRLYIRAYSPNGVGKLFFKWKQL